MKESESAMNDRNYRSVRYWNGKYKEIPIQAKLALWIMFCNIVQKGISLITVPIFTRIMDTTQYGRVSAYFSWVSIVQIITSFRLGAGVYNKGLSKYKDDQDGYCLSMQYTTSITTLIVFAIFMIFHRQFGNLMDMSIGMQILMFVELFFANSMGFWTVRQQYDFNYRPIVIATLTLAILNPTLGLIFVLNTPGESRGLARIISTVTAQALVGGFFYILNLKKGKFSFKTEYAKFAVKFNLPLIPHYFSEYILNQSDKVMIQKLCSYTDVAFYSVAYNAGMLLTIVTTSVNQALTPWLYQSLDKKNYKKISSTLLSLAICVMAILIIFICLAPEAIYILAGERYASAVYVLPPVAGSIVFLFLYTNFANVEFYYDYNKFTMYISMVGAALNIILNYIFIRIFGYVAAAYTTYVCYFVYCFGHYLFMEYIMKKKCGTHLFDAKKVLGLFAVLTFVILTMSLTYTNQIMRYCIIAAMILILYFFRRKIKELLVIIKK